MPPDRHESLVAISVCECGSHRNSCYQRRCRRLIPLSIGGRPEAAEDSARSCGRSVRGTAAGAPAVQRRVAGPDSAQVE